MKFSDKLYGLTDVFRPIGLDFNEFIRKNLSSCLLFRVTIRMTRHPGSATKDEQRNPSNFTLLFRTEPEIYFEDSVSKWTIDATNIHTGQINQFLSYKS